MNDSSCDLKRSTKLYTESLIWQVLSVAMVNAGSAHDIIPDSATIGGTYRAFSKKSFYSLRKRIEEVIAWLCMFHTLVQLS